MGLLFEQENEARPRTNSGSPKSWTIRTRPPEPSYLTRWPNSGRRWNIPSLSLWWPGRCASRP